MKKNQLDKNFCEAYQYTDKQMKMVMDFIEKDVSFNKSIGVKV